MPNSSRFFLLLLLLPFLVLTSCKKDNDEVIADVRDELVGTYKYFSGGIDILASSQIEISKDPQHADRINILFKQMNYKFYANNLNRTAEGVTFEIPKQLTYISGFPFLTEGRELVKINELTQQGVFFRNNQELQMGLKATILNSSLEEVANFSGLIVARRNQ